MRSSGSRGLSFRRFLWIYTNLRIRRVLAFGTVVIPAHTIPRQIKSGFQIPLPLAAYTAVGPIAQSVEQRTFNPWVDGSSPSGPTGVFLVRGFCPFNLEPNLESALPF